MKEIKNVIICGIGAIGSIYANIISNFDNKNLKILVDEKRLKKYLENPISYNGEPLYLNYILPSATNFKADLVLIATKNDGLADACKNLKNFIYEDTIILSFLNGIESEEIISKIFGREKVLNSYIICHSAMRKGSNVIHDGVNTIYFGAINKTQEQKVKITENYFQKAGINYFIPKDIVYSQWKKFALNSCANPLTAIFKFTFKEALDNEKFMKLAKEIIKEVQQIAKAEGVKNSENILKDTIESLHTMLPEGKTSMLQDTEAGRKTEIDIFAGKIIQLGELHSIPTPYNKIIKEMIEVIEQHNLQV